MSASPVITDASVPDELVLEAGCAEAHYWRDLWRYRVGDYRILCDLQDNRLTILVLQLGNRREIYR